MIASAVVQTTTTTAAPSTLDLLSGIVASSPTSLPVDAARTYNAPSQFSCSTPALINLVGLGAEIFCHCDQCCDGLFIIIRRGQPMAEISLSSEVVGTRHIEIPFDQDQLQNLRRVPTVGDAGLPCAGTYAGAGANSISAHTASSAHIILVCFLAYVLEDPRTVAKPRWPRQQPAHRARRTRPHPQHRHRAANREHPSPPVEIALRRAARPRPGGTSRSPRSTPATTPSHPHQYRQGTGCRRRS
jgi:hypothetical protein